MVWLIDQIQTRVALIGMVKRTARVKKNFMPEELHRNQPILRFDVILQHDWPIEQFLLHIRVFFSGKTKRLSFDLWLIKQITKHLPKPFF